MDYHTLSAVLGEPQLSKGEQRGHSVSGKVIVVFGTRVGVGKTVVATHLAGRLARQTGQPVCLVDLDVTRAGEAARLLRLSVTRSLADLMPMAKRYEVIEPHTLEKATAPHPSGIHVLTAVTQPQQLVQLHPAALAVTFDALKRRYPYIIVDGGSVFSDQLLAAFEAANLLLLVTTPALLSLYQTKWALALVENLTVPSQMVKVVLNQTPVAGALHLQDAHHLIPCEILGEIPEDGEMTVASQRDGMFSSEQTAAASALRRLTDILMTRHDLYGESRQRARGQGASWIDGEAAVGSGSLYVTPESAVLEESTDEMVMMKRRIHERLVDELDLKKLVLTTAMNNEQMSELRRKTERVLHALLGREAQAAGLSPAVRGLLVKEIIDEALGLGPLEEFLADPEVTDILVNNKDQIYVERRGRLELTTRRFISNDQVFGAIERITAQIGRRIDESSPMVDARLPDGSRINAIIPPLSLKGPVLSIRKFSRISYTQEDLIRFGTLTPEMMAFLRACVLARKNLLISGGAGSGKTTLLNVISSFISSGDRVITIEDAAELKLAQAHWVSLEARPPNIEGKGQVTMRDLFRNALRMRPDRIIIGECRGAETLDMLQAMNTGHEGSITTVHANSPRDVITRLDSMVLISNIDLPIRAIRQMVASGLQVIIHMARLSDGSRKIISISELTGMIHETEIVMQDLFVFQQTGVTPEGAVLGRFVATGARPTFFEELTRKGIVLDEAIFTASPTR